MDPVTEVLEICKDLPLEDKKIFLLYLKTCRLRIKYHIPRPDGEMWLVLPLWQAQLLYWWERFCCFPLGLYDRLLALADSRKNRWGNPTPDPARVNKFVLGLPEVKDRPSLMHEEGPSKQREDP